MPSPTSSNVITHGQGEARWWGDALAVIKIAEPGGELAVVDITESPGSGTPPGRVTKYNVYVLVLEGEATWTVGDETFRLRSGDSLSIPRGESLAQSVGKEGCRWIGITTPGGFEDLVRGLSEPAEALTLPPPPGVWPDTDPAPLLEEHGMVPAR
jgi:quercetin dioxygenase-like cupin family protein